MGVAHQAPSETRVYRWTALAATLVAATVFCCAVAVAVELPLGDWDSLAFGTWGRSIAEHWPHLRFASAGPADYQRPVFYVLEGTLWRIFGFHESLARLLGVAFGVLLAAALAYTAARTTPRRYAAAAAAIVVGLLLAVSPFERFVVAGLSDIPVAAMLAVTGALALVRRRDRVRLPLLALSACLAVLTKPTALASLVGLAAAVLVGSRAGLSRRSPAAAAIAAGTFVALVYDGVQAHLSRIGLRTFLTFGTDGFYASLAAQHRRRELLDESWLGPGLRVLLIFAVVYGLVRLVRPHRPAVAAAFVLAAAWSVLGPRLAGTGSGLVPGVTGFERVVVLVTAASLLFALAAPAEAVVQTLDVVRLLVWLAPPLVVWFLYSDYDIRLLSAAWPPLVLLLTSTFVPALAGAAHYETRLAAIPAAAVLALGAYGSVQLAGFGSDGWHRFTSGFGDSHALRDLALGGDFAAELDAVQPEARWAATIVTADSRLAFYYPRKVRLEPPTSCAQLDRSAALVLLESDEERALYGNKAQPGYWQACRHPTPLLVAERPGAFAILTTGRPVAAAGGCGVAPPSGLAVEFGTFPSPRAAQADLARVKAVGFVQATVQRLGCSTYAVLETGIPSRDVGRSIVAEARMAKLRVRLIETP